MIPAWVNFVAGLACTGLAVNFFAMAYAPKSIGTIKADLNVRSYRPLTAEEAARNNIPLTQNNAPPQ